MSRFSSKKSCLRFAAVSPDKGVPRGPQILLQGTLEVSGDICAPGMQGVGARGAAPPTGPGAAPQRTAQPPTSAVPGEGLLNEALPTPPSPQPPARQCRSSSWLRSVRACTGAPCLRSGVRCFGATALL